MKSYCVVVADNARARFFHLGDGNNLVEVDDLVNPEGEAAGKEIYAENKSGRNSAPMQAGAHGYDDHRNGRRQQVEQRFAHQIADKAVNSAGRHQANQLLIVANDHLLGRLRNELKVPPTAKIQVKEVAKNLSKLKPSELHEHLAADGVVPARSTAP